nr:hypothetical protein [uncultured Holophaga sp.]
MKIKMLSGVCLGSGKDAHKDDVVEVPDHQGLQLIARGKAVESPEDDAKKAAKK